MEGDGRDVVARLLRRQVDWCSELGSPLYAHLLTAAADDCAAGGPVWKVLIGHEDDPTGSALALRFMGAMHRLVLQGRAPNLSSFYPTAGGDPSSGDPWPAFLSTVTSRGDALRLLVKRPVQTNEVGRSAALLGGFLIVALETGLPMRLLEIGASAGLNLRWDRFRYESGEWSWGDPGSPVRFTEVFSSGGRPPGVDSVEVVERAGCDAEPVDPTTPEGSVTVQAYVWPDQARRFERLRGALEVAASVPATVARADGPDWLSSQLVLRADGVATVVFHSIVSQYLGEEGRERLRSVVHDAGARATRRAPLAWLRFEPTRGDGGGDFEVLLTTWPGGEERVLAAAHPHGLPVEWLA